MKLNIEVTAEDCAEGCRCTEHYCVVATAIGRIIPAANRIEVNVNTIRFTLKQPKTGKTFRYVYRTPDAVRNYIRDFDAGQDARPMKFVLDQPEITELPPPKPGRAKTPSFKAKEPAKTRRSVRVFGERVWQRVDA